MKELRFPTAACSVSPEELKLLSLSLSFFFSTVYPALADDLLPRLLEISPDFTSLEAVQVP